jgi:hypothetical protein
MATINLGGILTDVVTVIADVEVDQAELAAGQVVVLPVEPEVGTEGGAPVYLTFSLSTTKQTAAAPLATANAATPIVAAAPPA